MQLNIGLTSTNLHLKQIKELQSKNLKTNLTAIEANQQGFVTAEYSLEFLTQMHNVTPAIIALNDNALAGYALVCNKQTANNHDLLLDLCNSIDSITYKNQPLSNVNYILVGQLCVAKEYRGIGLVQKMYAQFNESYGSQYQYCITDVAADNPRSLKTHIKTGFEIIDTKTYGGISWDVILWPWNS